MENLTNFHHRGNVNGEIWVSLFSERFKNSKRIPYINDLGSATPALETAKLWLASQGFELIGQAETTNNYYIISSTFKAI